jgi:transcriptional regulator with XRE-family HTH domain
MAKTGEPSPGEGDRRRMPKDLLRWYREERGLSQEELAALVEPPLSPETISNLERGRTRPYRHTLNSVCRALGLTGDQAQEVWMAWRTIRGAADRSWPDRPTERRPGQAHSPSADHATSPRRREPDRAPADVVLPTTGTITFLFTEQHVRAVQQSVAAGQRVRHPADVPDHCRHVEVRRPAGHGRGQPLEQRSGVDQRDQCEHETWPGTDGRLTTHAGSMTWPKQSSLERIRS